MRRFFDSGRRSLFGRGLDVRHYVDVFSGWRRDAASRQFDRTAESKCTRSFATSERKSSFRIVYTVSLHRGSFGVDIGSEAGSIYRKVKRDPKVMQLKRRKRDLEEFNGSFQADAPTYIVVHGWKSSTQSDTVQNIKNGYLMTRECNVIGMEIGSTEDFAVE